ncbi:MAG TPA: DUF971 domain-containing protein [Steroidobacteraceae bacterium]|nr:DUF971 domain-containing protein [Steroidobacteraceae bacterium]
MSLPVAVEIRLHARSRVLDVSFDDGTRFELPAEYLRVHSPSAEVQGHNAGEGVLVTGKEQVGIRAIEPIGHYAVRLVFDDGHDTGLYTWKYLHELGTQRDARWRRYLQRLESAGVGRGGDGPAPPQKKKGRVIHPANS